MSLKVDGGREVSKGKVSEPMEGVDVITKIVREIRMTEGEIEHVLIEHARKRAGLCLLVDSRDKSEKHDLHWATIFTGRSATVVISCDPPKARIKKEDL
ncbi:hypothetical protein BSZ19_18510 [Bradyrhizobium japonicum]|uniref:Uncharacterized protein n=1 Tax=Bradyrhizobium japonicum TaxID=375 RepID=A0A1Y2JNX9_BRAJP|nr:hypothetical protein [Bradyrhizobium japonicum]OSJ32545.1 hypothetical protein BSZ19_18510 [Bradyrhizobium japonicum]